MTLIDSFFMHSFIKTKRNKLKAGFDCRPGSTGGWEEGCAREQAQQVAPGFTGQGREQGKQVGGENLKPE